MIAFTRTAGQGVDFYVAREKVATLSFDGSRSLVDCRVRRRFTLCVNGGEPENEVWNAAVRDVLQLPFGMGSVKLERMSRSPERVVSARVCLTLREDVVVVRGEIDAAGVQELLRRRDVTARAS